MRVLYNNMVMSSVITKTTENVNYPVSNLQDSRQSRYYRSTDDAAQRITFHLDTTVATYVVIMGHNLTAGATVRLEGNDADAWGAPSFSQVLTVADIILANFASSTYNYWSLYIDDAANPNTYLQIAYVYIGTYLQLPGMKPGQALPYSTTSKGAISSGGQAYGSHGYEYRAFEVNYPWVTDAQRKTINTFFDAVRNYEPFVLLMWANDLVFEVPVYAIVTDSVLPWARNDDTNFPWNVKIKFQEVF